MEGREKGKEQTNAERGRGVRETWLEGPEDRVSERFEEGVP